MAMDGVERSRLIDENARLKKEAREKENELRKRHAQQLKHIQSENLERIQDLQKNQQATMEEQRERTNEALTKRDVVYQKQIRDLQNMHRDRMKEVGDKTDQSAKSTDVRHRREVEHLVDTKDSQFERMKTGYENQIKQQQKEQSEYVETTRQAQAEGLRSERDRLTNAHEEDRNRNLDYHREKVSELENKYSTEHQARNEQSKEFKVKNMQQRELASEQLLDAVRRERQDGEAVINNKDMAYGSKYKILQDNLLKRADERDQKTNMAIENLKEDVYGRTNRRERALERKIQDEGFARERELVSVNRVNQVKEENLRANFGDQIDNLEEQRSQQVEASNQETAKKIQDVRGKYDEQFGAQNNFYLDKINTTETIHRRNLDAEVGRLTEQKESTEIRANERIQNIKGNYEKSTKDNQVFYEESLGEAKNAYNANLTEMRFTKDQERLQVEARLKSQMRNQIVEAEKKLQHQRLKYEGEIDEIKDLHRREVRRLQENHKKVLDALHKGHKTDVESKEIEMKDRLEQQRVAFERKTDNMERSFEQQKAEWAKIQRS